jgi:prephenate dehydrogenase
MIDRVAVIGLGLIGGSFAAGLKQRKLAKHVSAFDLDAQGLEFGLREGIIDSAAGSVADACANAELVMLAVPVLSVQTILPDVPTGALITDVGSVKVPIIAASEAVYGEMLETLVPGHPIAGSEQHGIAAADPNLFEKHRVILTPVAVTDPVATDRVRQLWQDLGSTVIEMSVEHHDSVLAQTSHLPHLLAYALVDSLSLQGDSMEVFQYAAGGFRDFSRIAASDPVMWRDIFKANGPSVLAVLDRFLDELDDLRRMIADGDVEALQQVFQRAKEARDCYSEQYSE